MRESYRRLGKRSNNALEGISEQDLFGGGSVLVWGGIMGGNKTCFSPNPNPIEQVWDELGRLVRKNHAIHTVNALATALQAEWVNSPAPFIQRYVDSMHRRITACIAQNGEHMRY